MDMDPLPQDADSNPQPSPPVPSPSTSLQPQFQSPEKSINFDPLASSGSPISGTWTDGVQFRDRTMDMISPTKTHGPLIDLSFSSPQSQNPSVPQVPFGLLNGDPEAWKIPPSNSRRESDTFGIWAKAAAAEREAAAANAKHQLSPEEKENSCPMILEDDEEDGETEEGQRQSEDKKSVETILDLGSSIPGPDELEVDMALASAVHKEAVALVPEVGLIPGDEGPESKVEELGSTVPTDNSLVLGEEEAMSAGAEELVSVASIPDKIDKVSDSEVNEVVDSIPVHDKVEPTENLEVDAKNLIPIGIQEESATTIEGLGNEESVIAPEPEVVEALIPCPSILVAENLVTSVGCGSNPFDEIVNKIASASVGSNPIPISDDLGENVLIQIQEFPTAGPPLIKLNETFELEEPSTKAPVPDSEELLNVSTISTTSSIFNLSDIPDPDFGNPDELIDYPHSRSFDEWSKEVVNKALDAQIEADLEEYRQLLENPVALLHSQQQTRTFADKHKNKGQGKPELSEEAKMKIQSALDEIFNDPTPPAIPAADAYAMAPPAPMETKPRKPSSATEKSETPMMPFIKASSTSSLVTIPSLELQFQTQESMASDSEEVSVPPPPVASSSPKIAHKRPAPGPLRVPHPPASGQDLNHITVTPKRSNLPSVGAAQRGANTPAGLRKSVGPMGSGTRQGAGMASQTLGFRRASSAINPSAAAAAVANVNALARPRAAGTTAAAPGIPQLRKPAAGTARGVSTLANRFGFKK